MKQINLQEYVPSGHDLTADQRDVLLQKPQVLPLDITPVKGTKGKYSLTPGSTVGALEIDDLSVLIKPKIGIRQLLSLACYAIGVYKPKEPHLFNFQQANTLPDVLALALIAAARRSFARGILRGYLSEEDALYTVRGRIRFDEQIRRRYSIPLPVELGFDEFTEDILPNRLVKAAAARLGRMTLRSPEARRGLGWIAAMLENVALIEFRRRRLPEVRFDRLNEHYRHAVGLARLILLHSEFESRRGEVRASGFLVDMNILFQKFLTQALRESLGVTKSTLKAECQLPFDVDSAVTLKPDLSWWDGSVCKFVGDAKYKNITGSRVPNADLYQLLAYATALNLPGGLLIYAKGEAETTTFTVRNADKILEVFSLDISGTLNDILARVDTLACKVNHLYVQGPAN